MSFHSNRVSKWQLSLNNEGLVLSSVANLVHLCGEDVGSNPAWTFSGR
jgi:hypothetical protein